MVSQIPSYRILVLMETNPAQNLIFKIKKKLKHTAGAWMVESYRKVRAQKMPMDLLNRKSRAAYRSNQPPLTTVQKRIVDGLECDGLCLSSVAELMGNNAALSEIRSFADKEFEKASAGRNKKFLFYLWDNAPIFDHKNPLITLALSKQIRGIADAYLQLFARFVFFSVNKTVIVNADADAQGSQRWHRDPTLGDERLCKVFIYLNDVDATAGPFTFIKGTHKTGRLSRYFPAKQPDGIYPPPGAVEAIPDLKNEITPCIGKAGTIVFCDTSGLHKGGFSVEKERIMATLFYVSPASLQRENFSYPEDLAPIKAALSPEATRALGL